MHQHESRDTGVVNLFPSAKSFVRNVCPAKSREIFSKTPRVARAR